MSEPAASNTPSPAPATPVATIGSAAETSSAPAQVARKQPELLPLGEEDRSILSHLGLPFYYRHAPASTARRATFWIAFLVILIIVFANFLFMPYPVDTLMYNLRMLIFGGGRPHQTLEDGLLTIFSQLSVVSIILSCVLAPLFATFSFSSERVLGTMEFLRLSPMSTLSIVMGKMFAPALQLHKISFACMALACLFGFAGGVSPESIAMGMLTFVLSVATLHAIGALFANLSAAWRGFGAVGGLLGVGFFVSFLPILGWEERGYEFIAFLSPWSAFDGLFWHSFYSYRSNRYNEAPRIFGSVGLVKVYVLAFHALFFSLLVWAASRKLDDENQTALPKAAWFGLWFFFVVSAIGLAINVSMARQVPNRGWEDAAVVTMIASIGLVILMLLDHPHRRELILTQLCECLAGREKPPSALRLMSHSLFVSGVTGLAAITVISFLSKKGLPQNVEWTTLALYALIPILVVFMAATAIESAFVGYSSRIGRVVACAVVWAILAAAMFAPLIHAATVSSRFYSVTWAYVNDEQNRLRLEPQIQAAEAHLAQLKKKLDAVRAKPVSTKTQLEDSDLQNQISQANQNLTQLKQQLNWSTMYVRQSRLDSTGLLYLADIKNAKDARALQQQYGQNIFALLWRYHAGTFIFYPIVFVLVVAMLFVWRARIYRNLHKEAERAVQPTAV